MSTTGKLFRSLWLLFTIGLIAYGLKLALWDSPPDAAQGNMARAFYYHMPNWIGSLLFFGTNLAASITYLALRRQKGSVAAMKADSLALASAEMGTLYCALGLISGSLWGRVAWGIWWTWDARLTATLVLWLIYVSYLMVRRFVTGSDPGAICAVLAIFGFCDVPLVYMSTRWWRTQHPGPVFGGDPGSFVDPSMQAAVWWNVAAWVAWGILIASIRYSVELRRQKLEAAKALVAIESQGVEHV